jgi:hypothetical protein
MTGRLVTFFSRCSSHDVVLHSVRISRHQLPQVLFITIGKFIWGRVITFVRTG